MKKLTFVLSAILILTQTALPSRALSAKAEGSSKAITISWEGTGGTWHQIRRVSPTSEMLSPKPFAGSSWIDTNPSQGVNTYEIEALDSNLNHIASLQASAQTNAGKPTLLMPCSTVLSFSVGSKTFQQDGRKAEMTAAPMLKDGKTYLVIRYVAEPLGGTIGFDKATGKVTVNALGHTVEMWLGNPKATVDGVEKLIDAKNPKVAPFVVGGRTYVPLRFPVESLGRGTIDWIATSKTAILTFPLGCAENIEGEIKEVGSTTFTISDGASDTVLPITANTNPTSGSCAIASYEKVDGKSFTGNLLTVPCTECEGDIFSGTVVSSGDSLVIKDIYGNIRTFKKGSSGFSPVVGSCVTGCATGDTISSLRYSQCPAQVFEGKILTTCKDGFFSLSIEGVSYQVKVPASFDCSRIATGSCATIEGSIDDASPNTINATKINIVPCVTGREYTVYAQSACTGRTVAVADIDGNAYTLTLPPGTPCDVQGGTCLKVFATVDGSSMVATKVQTIQPPKESAFWFKAFVSYENPLVVAIPGGRSYTLTLPPYFKVNLTKLTGLEIWGRMKGDIINSVRVVVVPNMGRSVSGRIIDLMCETGMAIVKTGQTKTGVKLPADFDCKTLAVGDCIKATGILEGETVLGAVIEKVECQSGCTGKTIRGTVVGVDCPNLTIRIKTEEGNYYNIVISPQINCSSYYKGVCVSVCGEIDGDRIIADTINLTDCPRNVCDGKIAEGVIQSVDCGQNTVTLATKEGLKTFKVPETTDCSRLSPGQCAEICFNGDVSNYMTVQNCSVLGTSIEGTIVKDGIVEQADGTQLKLKTEVKTNIGDCIIAIGQMSEMEQDTFIARIVAIVPCAGSSGFAGKVEAIDCVGKKITVSTATGLKEALLPDGFDCSSVSAGDCVFVKITNGKASINKINCPDYERMQSAIFVTAITQDFFTGVDLSSLIMVKVIGSYNVSRGSTVIANGHRLDAISMDGAYVEPITRGVSAKVSATLKFNSYDKTTGIAGFEEPTGNMRLIIVDPESVKNAKPGDIFTMKITVWDTGFGPRAEIGTEVVQSPADSYASQTAVGVIFAIDPVDEMILVHTHDGNNCAVKPADTSVLKSVRIGDCVIATGKTDKALSIMTGAKLDVSDCAGGEIGRSFTGIITGIEATKSVIQVSADSGGTYEVYTEAVSQLTGLTLGDCVAVSGIVLGKAKPLLILGKLIQRIECKNPSNQPVSVEGTVVEYTETTRQLRFESQFGGTWTAFVEMADMPQVDRGTSVRVSGRMQARTFTMSKAFVTRIELPPARWSVSGKVTEKLDKAFKLTDTSGRAWILHSQSVPEPNTQIMAVGIVPTFGMAELVDVQWLPTEGWTEPKSSFSGVVFGVSCGNDNLLIRGKFGQMTSLRLPHTSFCGFFGIGECVAGSGRLQGAMPGLAKVTDVSGNQSVCFDAAIVGRIIARSTTDKSAILQTLEGQFIRLGYDTEVIASKLLVGDNAKITGRFIPSQPDTLKVETLQKIGGLIPYETSGRIVQTARNSITIAEKSGRLLVVGLPEGYTEGNGLQTRYVNVKGQFDGGMFRATNVTVAGNPETAIEIEGRIMKTFDHTALIKDFQGGLWQVEIVAHQEYREGDNVFVAGWSDSTGWWKIRGAAIFATSGEKPSTSAMIWGNVTEKNCDENSVTFKADDGSSFKVFPSDKGTCDLLTAGERVQVSGIVQPDMKNTFNGARISRPGLVGDKKVVIGTIIEISCVSRVAKVQENARDGIPGSLWTVRLDKSVDCESLKVGDAVKVTGDLVLTQQLTLADSTVEKQAALVETVTVTGMINTLDCDNNLLIIQSEGKLFRIHLSDFSDCFNRMTTGDTIKVTGKCESSRRQIINDATFVKIPDETPYQVVKARVINTACKNMRVLVLDGKEFWTINFQDGEPCEKVADGMILTFKGMRDVSSTHLMLKALILDRLLPRVAVGTVDEIYCDTGTLTIVEDSGGTRTVHVEPVVAECLAAKLSKGDRVQVRGYQDILFSASDMFFASIEPLDKEMGMVSMDFTAELLDVSDCRNQGVVHVRSGHITWRVKLPDGTDCQSIKAGKWYRIKGGRQSFVDKTMIARSFEETKPLLIGFVNEANYSIPELEVKELIKAYRWKVQLADKSRTRDWQKGQYVVVTGDIAGDMRLSNASLVGMTMTKGKITMIDPASQSIEVEGDDLLKYKVYTKTDWIDLTQFAVGNVITIVGIPESEELSKTKQNIIRECFIEESSGLPPPPTTFAPILSGFHKPFVDLIEPKLR